MCTSSHLSARQCDWVGGPILCFLSLYDSWCRNDFSFSCFDHTIPKPPWIWDYGVFLFYKVFKQFHKVLWFVTLELSCFFLKRGWVRNFLQTNIRTFSKVWNIFEFQFNSFQNVSIAGFHHLAPDLSVKMWSYIWSSSQCVWL